MSRVDKPKFCGTKGTSVCGADNLVVGDADTRLMQIVLRILKQQGAISPLSEQKRFVEVLSYCVRRRNVELRKWANGRLPNSDIIRLIQITRDARDFDEAVWRCFLAAHLGRTSSDKDDQQGSAALLLCGFGTEPKWTWRRVSSAPGKFMNWLYDNADDLGSLVFGNHRKYESAKPDLLWEVIESFIELCDTFGGPTGLLEVVSEDGSDAFEVLYRRMMSIHRFGRTGVFDFVVLLLDLRLISAEPKSCYLCGATGPKKGAILLWGKRAIGELEDMAAELAGRLRISPIVIEDALCNWQK